jgi:hypothetical protein
MQLTAGAKLMSVVSSTEVIVVRPPNAEVDVTCGGASMVEPGDTPEGTVEHPAPGGMALLGKRYTDETTGIELLCTKGGAGELACDGRPLVVKAAKPLPSSD